METSWRHILLRYTCFSGIPVFHSLLLNYQEVFLSVLLWFNITASFHLDTLCKAAVNQVISLNYSKINVYPNARVKPEVCGSAYSWLVVPLCRVRLFLRNPVAPGSVLRNQIDKCSTRFLTEPSKWFVDYFEHFRVILVDKWHWHKRINFFLLLATIVRMRHGTLILTHEHIETSE